MRLHRKAFYTQTTFTHGNLLQTESFTQRNFLHRVPCMHRMVTECAKYFPVLLRTTGLTQSTSQYYFILRDLHKARTTLYYKACTNAFPVLLCTTKLAQSTSQYYFVLQALHKILPRITLRYKACTKHFPALLCTRELAQSTSRSTTLYYKACTTLLPSTTLY